MTLITGDFETYYSKDYNLRKLSEVEYICDDRFQAIMLGLKEGDGPVEILAGDAQIRERLTEYDWDDVAFLSHNARFDAAILGWRFGCYPKLYLDTLSMARATTHWHIGRSSLGRVSEFLGLPAKGDEIIKAQGKRLEDFTRDELADFMCYCARDTDNCYEIFRKLQPAFAAGELVLIDLIIRMFVRPQIQLNPALLEKNYQSVLCEKAAAMARVESMPAVFASNGQFVELLEEHGVEVPYKTSPTTGKTIPAVARGDWQFKELCLDDTLPPLVQAILAARLAVKSTLEETRSRNLIKLASIMDRWAPVPLKYAGARTGRLSGDGGANWQNLPRGSLLRQAIEAPPGYRIVHRDASQIEARVTAWMANCATLLDAFREGRDVYSEFATVLYERPITKADTLERWCGKTSILSLGYGAGAKRFRQMLFIGTGGLSLKVEVHEAQQIVDTYRETYPAIPALWRHAGTILNVIVGHSRKLHRKDHVYDISADYDHIPVEPDFDSLRLPNGLRIYYPNLRLGDDGLVYDDATFKTERKIYGAKFVENWAQSLARIVVTDIAVRVKAATDKHPFLTCHDSLDYCVPRSEAEAMDAELERQFAIVPAWGEGLPLASEGGWGRDLASAERAENA